MRRRIQALALAAALVGGAQAGQITGTVVSARGGEPLASVELTLSAIRQVQEEREQGPGRRGPRGSWSGTGSFARTSLDGRFVFENVEPGEYVIAASKAGFDGGGRIARRVSLSASDLSASLSIKLNRSPSVEGRVVDGDGDPLAKARVELRFWTMSEGGRTLRTARFATTDDRGEYRLYNLTPGQYLIYLHPTSLGAMPGGVLYETSGAYYPHGSSAAEAAKLNLDWGADLKGVDFVAPPAGGTLVSGALLLEDGSPCQDCSLTILDASGMPVAATRASEAGRFAVHGLTAGEYGFMARAPRGVSVAAEKLYLPDGRPVETSLQLTPGQAVSGAVSAKDVEAGKEIKLDRVTIRLTPAESMPAGAPVGGRLEADQSFTIAAASPGEYRASLYGLPSNGYLRRVLLAGAEAPDGKIRVTSAGPVSGLELEAAFDGGSIQGRALDGDEPAPVDGVVVLMPLRSGAASDRAQIIGYGSGDGAFQIRGVAPGEYLILSTARGLAWDWSDPAAMTALGRKAARIEVRKREAVKADAPYIDGL